MKYLNYIMIFYFMLSLLFLNIDCTDYYQNEGKEAPQEFLDYWYFPEGSWWVYYYDSFYDTFKTIRTYIDIRDEYYPCDHTYLIVSKNTNKNKTPGNNQSLTFEGFCEGNKWEVRTNGSDMFWNLSYFFKYPYSLGDTITRSGIENNMKTIFIIDSQSITTSLGNLYNTLHVHYDWDYQTLPIPKSAPADLWITKNIGITRFYKMDSTKFELIDYYINK